MGALQHKRGTTAAHSTYTGPVGEITVDTDLDVAVVHDGTTAGGHPMVTDHGYLAGLTDDDHTLYVRADGTRAFTGAVRLPVLTTTERDALTPAAGWTIFNSTTVQTEIYDGSTWEAVPGAGGGGVTDHGALTGLSDADHVAGSISFTATDRLLGRSTAGSGAGEEITCTAAGRAILDDADAAAQRTTLGLTNAFIGAPMMMVPAAGEFVGNILTGALSTTGMSAGRMEIAPYLAGYSFTIDQLGISISTGAAGSAACVIFSADTNGRPTTLAVQSANIDTTTAATVLASASYSFVAGTVYWIGIWTSAACSLRCAQTTTYYALTWTSAATPVREAALRRNETWGGTSTAWTYAASQHSNVSAPFVLMRIV